MSVAATSPMSPKTIAACCTFWSGTSKARATACSIKPSCRPVRISPVKILTRYLASTGVAWLISVVIRRSFLVLDPEPCACAMASNARLTSVIVRCVWVSWVCFLGLELSRMIFVAEPMSPVLAIAWRKRFQSNVLMRSKMRVRVDQLTSRVFWLYFGKARANHHVYGRLNLFCRPAFSGSLRFAL